MKSVAHTLHRALRFYTEVLSFERVADREVAGDAYERLYGVFGARVRAVRLRLGDEVIELLEYLAPGPVALDGALGVSAGLLVRDPDGHAALLARH